MENAQVALGVDQEHWGRMEKPLLMRVIVMRSRFAVSRTPTKYASQIGASSVREPTRYDQRSSRSNLEENA